MKKKMNYVLTFILLLCVAMVLPTSMQLVRADEWDLDDELVVDGIATKNKVCYVAGEKLNTDDITLQVYSYKDGSIKTYKGKDIIVDTSGVDMTKTDGSEQSIRVSLKANSSVSDTVYVYVADEEGDSDEIPTYLRFNKLKTVYHVGDELNLDDIQVIGFWDAYEETDEGMISKVKCRALAANEYTLDLSQINMAEGGIYGIAVKCNKPGVVFDDNANYAQGYGSVAVYEIPSYEPTVPNQPTTPDQPVTPTQPTVPSQPSTPAISEPEDLTPVSDSSDMLPEKVSGLKVKAIGGKKISVKWKDSPNAWSFQIQLSTKKNFKNAKKKETYGNSITWKKLKKGKTYYVRVRATAIDGYSAWSKAKKVKVK